ncbi:MAG: NAD(P)-dependent glycerol-3-phosphate dehydrogenase [Proteobacteria bacterium]|nr:NAD(P)-dependent glycerol-3-phosphate dehydrogenase [Pseudomonadota bacterium]MCL2308548.1 NAD(P)-dependent glycerol-3-phosphate dehydrogenase [Pseudomonadota bacterium]
MMPPSFAVLGAGAWGTAFALHLTRLPQAPRVTLWEYNAQQAHALTRDRVNTLFLPDMPLPPELRITASLEDAVREATLLIAATPVAVLPELLENCRQITGATASPPPFFWLSKGLLTDGEHVFLPHQKLAPRWSAPVGVISGPSFAQEVAQGFPVALVVAATERNTAEQVATQIHGDTLRAYVNDDLPGVETGGAVKNVLAIAAGICDGLKFGHNARATLITRGLAEMARLAEALGGQRTTMMGLAGLGDLVLTCTGDLSRNRRVGLMLAEGLALPDILARLGHVAEGVPAAHAVARLAQRHAIEMPIATTVSQILDGTLAVEAAVRALLGRAPKKEFCGI